MKSVRWYKTERCSTPQHFADSHPEAKGRPHLHHRSSGRLCPPPPPVLNCLCPECDRITLGPTARGHSPAIGLRSNCNQSSRQPGRHYRPTRRSAQPHFSPYLLVLVYYSEGCDDFDFDFVCDRITLGRTYAAALRLKRTNRCEHVSFSLFSKKIV